MIDYQKEILLNQLETCIFYKKWNLNVKRNTFGNISISPAWLEKDEISDDKRFEISVEKNGTFFINGTGYECEHRCISEVMEVLQGLYDLED